MLNSISKTVIFELGILLVCILGDRALSSSVAKQHVVRAITDSLTHGLVGGLSWAVVTEAQLDKHGLVECFISMGLAMLVDIDHFIAARSLHLKNALSLKKRPFFHATTIIFIIDMFLLLLSSVLIRAKHAKSIQLFAMMFSISWFSHHIRDSTRRGLWFPPFGETPPLPKYLYLSAILLLPIVTKIIYYLWKTQQARTIQYYSIENV